MAPYARYAAGLIHTSNAVTFNCASADGTPFTETARGVLSGINSTQGEPHELPGWVVSDVLYTYDGVCGPAHNGAESSSAPTTNLLCSVGAPSVVTEISGAGDSKFWSWTCSAGNAGGTEAACASPVAISAATVSLESKECTLPPSKDADIVVLMDASKSMQTVVTAAKSVLDDLATEVSTAPVNVTLNTIVFGGTGTGYLTEDGSSGFCRYGHLTDMSLVVANWASPLIASMNFATKTDLTNTDNNRAIILVGDGLDTCFPTGEDLGITTLTRRTLTSSKVAELRASGISVYGVRIIDGTFSFGSGLSAFTAMNAYTTINTSTTTYNGLTDSLETALDAFLGKVTNNTCVVTAQVYDTLDNSLVGNLSSGGVVSLPPGTYKIDYSLCSQTSTQYVVISSSTTLASGLVCPYVGP